MVASKQKPKTTQTFKCGYCGKEYKRESSLIRHNCEKKKRALLRDTREAKVALDMWLRFRKFARIPYKKTLQPYDAFSESKEFSAFVDFAKYVIEVQPLKPDEFVDDLLKQAVPLRDWKTHKVRIAWTHKCLRTEHPDTAIERSIATITKWAQDTNEDWRQFFTKVSTQRALLMIETGRISPWFIYAASTKASLLDRFSDDEFMHLYEYINPQIWNAKKLKYKEDFARIENVFMENGL